MPPRRILVLAALAFLAGALVSGILLFDGPVSSLLSPSGPDIPVRIFVSNSGPYAANITASVDQLGGRAAGQVTYVLGSGSERTDALVLGAGEFRASVSADRGGIGTNTHQGTSGVTGKTSSCSGREALVFVFALDTTRGISFTNVRATCR